MRPGEPSFTASTSTILASSPLCEWTKKPLRLQGVRFHQRYQFTQAVRMIDDAHPPPVLEHGPGGFYGLLYPAFKLVPGARALVCRGLSCRFPASERAGSSRKAQRSLPAIFRKLPKIAMHKITLSERYSPPRSAPPAYRANPVSPPQSLWPSGISGPGAETRLRSPRQAQGCSCRTSGWKIRQQKRVQ